MRIVSAMLLLASLTGRAGDWPTFGHDNRRSHVTDESLTFPLNNSWAYKSAVPPQTAWTGPARWDAYAKNEGLQSMRNFDPAFFVTSVGDAVFFGSSADHAVHSLDANNGNENWVSFADGAVRLPPTWAGGRLYFGADDGFARCLDAKSGDEIWKFRPIENAKLIPSNGKLMSPFPVRTGVLVDGGSAFFGASLFPWEKSYLCAIDAKTGAKHFVNEQTGVTLQGIFLASTERLYAPQGRSVPLIFAKSSGSKLGDVPGTGGVYCILTEDEQFIAIPNNQKSSENTVKLASPDSREAILNIPGANRMIAAGQYLYFHQKGKLKAIDRAVASAAQSKMTAAQKKMTALKKAKAPAKLFEPFQKAEAAARLELKAADLWSSFQPVPSALILAGDHLILGGDGVVFAVDKNTGEQIWKADLSGRVYGLAVANGRLFASTDRGHIFCFSEATGSVR